MKEVANVLRQVRDTGITVYVITHDLELILDCCTDIVHFENGSIIDQFQMDEAGLEKIRNYFIKGVVCKIEGGKEGVTHRHLMGSGAKPYHWKFIGSIALAVLGVACQMVPYFCVAHIVTLMLSGDQNFRTIQQLVLLRFAVIWEKSYSQIFPQQFLTQRPITRCEISGRILPKNWPASRWGRF